MTTTAETTAQTPPKTLREHALHLAGAVVLVAITLALIELLLRTVDPWGLYYFSRIWKHFGNTIFTADATRGYVIPDGTHSFTRWQATVAGGGRVVPATADDDTCTIAILGDSVAFGYGVNDEATWVNVAAQALPHVRLLNLGVPRYNSTNVVGTWRTFAAADGFLYLIISNDLDPAIDVASERFVGGGQRATLAGALCQFWAAARRRHGSD
ncbi:hypothetical protein HC776_01960 [bacterium]|nr:hypothetical protein [bacterium]